MRSRITRSTARAAGILALGVIMLGIFIAGAARAELPPLIPRDVIFGNPERTAPQLSPDGKYFTYIAPEEGVLNVWLRTVGKEDDRAITHDRGRGVAGYFWGQNSRRVLYIQDKNGDENWRVYSVGLEGGEPIDLTPLEKVQARIISVDPRFPDVILVGINDRVPQLHDVYRVNIVTGERELAAQNDMGAAGWIADNTLVVRVALLPTPDGGFSIAHRATEDAEWKPILTYGNEDALTTSPVGFAADNKTLYMISSVGSNTAGLRSLDVETGEEKTIFSDPRYDVSNALIHPVTNVIEAVAVNGEKEEWTVLDKSIEADFAAIRKERAGEFQVIGRDLADRTWLVVYSADTTPVAFYAFDRATKKGTFLFTGRPQLEKHTLAEMKPVSYEARDGLTIHGYLSLPPGVPPKNLPTVINVHGGPWYREGWGYHPEAQWLANRGYACLQINFRGSTGYGKEFINAGDKEWGGKMQDDITDGVNWMIERGYSDPERVAIYGGSYGGYAVLVGLTKTPDLYACGVDMVGPSNLATFLATIPPYWEPLKPLFYKRIGHPEQDAELLKERSPLFHIDAIRAPLLIAQGANDPRVNRAESIQIRDALQKAGKTVEYIEYADEGHGFRRPETRIAFYAAAEKFLAQHIGGRFEPAAQ